MTNDELRKYLEPCETKLNELHGRLVVGNDLEIVALITEVSNRLSDGLNELQSPGYIESIYGKQED